MLLKNFKRYDIERHNPNSVGDNFSGANPFTDFNGVAMAFCKQFLSSTNLYPANGGTYYTNVHYKDVSLIIGSGNTPVNENDYCLAELIPIDVLIVEKVNVEFKHLEDKSQMIYKRTFTYTGENEITVKEIGLLKGLHWFANSSNYKDVLLARELLDTPLTISSGEKFTVSLALEI